MPPARYDPQILPFKDEDIPSNFNICKPDIEKPAQLKIVNVEVSESLIFLDRKLPGMVNFEENTLLHQQSSAAETCIISVLLERPLSGIRNTTSIYFCI